MLLQRVQGKASSAGRYKEVTLMDGKPTSEKLVLAIDIGTTYSGMSYCILEPGQTPKIHGVNRYPAQELVGNCKVPTIVYYDQAGKVKAVGAEALRDAYQAEEEDWVKAEWFKLHLRPRTRSSAHVTDEIPPLPKGKTAVQVTADYLRYMHSCARTYFTESNYNGADRWNTLGPQAEFILSHPNGWEGAQQGMMREAAIKAGLIQDNENGRARLFFVTEGEASLHFCIKRGLMTEATKAGKGVAIVDAGGGTIDISAYKPTSPNSRSLEEIAAPQCAFKGSIFVTQKATAYITELLRNSKFKDDIKQICETFDTKTKLGFVEPGRTCVIRFGRMTDQDEAHKVHHGQLRLPGADVEEFFKPSLASIVEMIENQCKTSKTEISSIFLVGGFAANNWLFNKLRETFTPRGFDVCRPDGSTNKAVAEGAVSFHVDHFVKARVAKHSYGTDAAVHFNPLKEDHIRRLHLVGKDMNGILRLQGFSVILPKNTSVPEAKEFRQHYTIESKFISRFNTIKEPVVCFRGLRQDPEWLDEDENMYSTLCYVQADLSNVPKLKKYSPHLKSLFYQIRFDIILSFGLTEFKACIAWEEEGVEKRGAAQMVYDPDMVIMDDDAPLI